jgi:hypothetical protein
MMVEIQGCGSLLASSGSAFLDEFHQVVLSDIRPDPVAAYARDPSGLQATIALPTPVKFSL